MAGRLEKHEDFVPIARANAQSPKPRKELGGDERRKVSESIEATSVDEVLFESRMHKMICIVFFREVKRRSGNASALIGVYRRVVVPERRISRRSGRKYLEAIDVSEMRRKTFRRDRITNAKLTGEFFKPPQSAIGFS